MEKMLARRTVRTTRESQSGDGGTVRTKRNPKSGHFCRNGGDTYIEMPRRRGRGAGDCTNETGEALFRYITLWLWVHERALQPCATALSHTHMCHTTHRDNGRREMRERARKTRGSAKRARFTPLPDFLEKGVRKSTREIREGRCTKCAKRATPSMRKQGE